jgi:hypothetical protein
MTTHSITFTKVQEGVPHALVDGAVASVVLPAGCVFVASHDGLQTWEEVASPHTADGSCHVRIDCDVYHGTPVTAALEIA